MHQSRLLVNVAAAASEDELLNTSAVTLFSISES